MITNLANTSTGNLHASPSIHTPTITMSVATSNANTRPTVQNITHSSFGTQVITSDSIITSTKDKGKAILSDDNSQHFETLAMTFIKQINPKKFLSVLKRCRNINQGSVSTDDFNPQHVSGAQTDSTEEISSFSVEVAFK
uniref:Uncharacterized protein n=1 Tax=Cannabis sativa TaxID=3483 RepID=A0A803PT15_CANSA